MNKIFKVVWNRTIGSFVVTSELAKGRVKSSSEGAEGDVRASEEGRLKTLFRLTALSAALLGFSEGAWAAMNAKPATGGAVFAIGDGSTSANGTGALAIGNNAQAKTNGALAIGPNSTHTTIANSNNSIAIGVNLQATGQKAIGIGADTNVNGTSAIAIGNNDSGRITNQGVSGDGAIGVGSNLTVRGNNAIAVGTEAQAKEISTVAVGANTQATGAEAVAIGKGAASTASKALAFGQGAQAKDSDTVAVGTAAQATLANSIAIGKNSFARGLYSGVTGAGRAIAVGFNTQAIGEDSVAIGSGVDANAAALAQNRQSVALGWQARATGTTQAVAIGPDARASGAQSTSIGNNTRATGASSIAIGGDDWDDAKKSVNAQYKVLTGSDMSGGYQSTTATTAAVAVGVKAQATGALSTAFGPGTIASGLGASAFGVGASATQDKSVAIGAGSHTNTDATAVTTATVNGITYGGFAGTTHITPGSQVSFGSAGYERQLKHVAPGEITATSTDAINGSQLYALHAGSGNIAKAVADALGGGAAVGTDPTNRQGTVTLPSYDVFTGNVTPNATGNSATKFNTAAATNVGSALTNLNTYVNQGFAVKDNAGAAKGIVTPGESVQFADGNATTVTVDTEANGNTKIKYDVKVDDNTIKVVDGKLTGASQTHFYSVKNEDQTKGNYNNNGATGDNALAAGVDASATANGTTAVGLKAQASAESAIAVGSETKAAAKNAVVIGNKASVEAATGSVASVNGTTTGEGSVAVGAASKASGTNATAVGQAANAFGQNSFAGGQNSKASGKSSVAIGDGANATDDSSSAVGPYAQATKSGASAFGYYANALGENSLAAGRNAQATNANAVALGNESKATGQNTIAFGNNANASQNQAMALGRNTVASAGYTVALGDEAKATATKAIAFGSSAQATGANSVATGVQAKAHADDALAVGSNANASGESAIALGKQSNAWKVNSLAFGNSANSNGERAIAIGLESVSNGQNAVSVGQKAYAHEHGVAIGSESNAAQAAAIAIGNKAQAMKYSSIVIGEEAKSNNSRSVVIGYYASATNPAMSASNQDTNQTVAIGAYANAWGDQSTAIGNNVDAKGNSSIAIGADDWDTVAVKTVAGTGKTVKQVYQDYTGDVMETGDDTYTHTTSGEAAVAIGTKSQAEGELSTAFGTGTRAQGVASAAFGMGAKATKGNSVAIGAGSTTTTDATSVNEAKVNDLKYSGFAGGNNVTSGDQVSFGSKNYERQLKNVAPGEISNTSTDAINGSQLYAVQNVLGNTAQTVKDVLGGNAKLAEDGSITMSNIGNTGAGNIHDAINSVKETAEKGWKLKVNEEASSEKISPDDEVAIKEGKNIKVTRNGKNITVATAENVEFNKVTVGDSILTSAGLTTPKVTAGDSVLTTDGLTIANGANPVSLTKSGLNNGGNKITKVAKGTEETDAVNVSQLNPVAKALNTSIDPATGEVVEPNFTVNHADGTAGTPVHTVQDALNEVGKELNKGLNIAADKGDADKVNLGETVTYTSKDKNIVTTVADNKIDFSLADKITVGKAGQNPVVIDGTNGTVSGLTNKTLGGADFATSDKAATEAQLDATQVNLKTILGGKAANNNGNVTTSNIGETGADNVHDAIKSVKETAEKGWKLKVNEEASSEKISPDDEVAIKEGKNIKVTRNGKNITVATAENVEFNKVTVGDSILTSAGLTTPKVTAGDSVLTTDGLTIANGANPVSLTKSGLNNGGNKITKVAKGTEETDAVNVSQLNPVAKALNTSIDPATGEVVEPNFTVNHADGTAGTPVHTVQDALNEVGKELNKGLNIAADKGDADKVNLGETVTYTSKDKNIVTTVADNEIDFSLADKITVGKAGQKPVVIDGTTGTVSGLTNKTLGGADFATKGQAATEEQLNETQANLRTILGGNAANNNGNVTTNNIGGTGKDNVHEAIAAVKETADKGWNLKANDETDSEKIAAGDTVTVKQGKNIRVKRSGKDLTVETEDDVEFAHVKADSVEATSVVAESVIAGNSVLTTDGLKIGADGSPSQVSLTTAGLNNGGNKIANVAKGVADTDAVNVSQLNPIAKALNTSINPTTGAIEAPVFTVTKADGTKHEAVGTIQDALDKVGEEVGKGLNIVADNGSSEKVNLGDTVTYTSKDKNIVTTSGTGKAIDFSLAEKVTIGKDAANGGKPVVIDGKEGIVSGLTNTTLGSAPLAGSNKAATEAQLDATQVNLATILGGNAANNNGNVTTNNIGGTGKDNVHEAIAAVKETADKGWNLKANDETDSEKIAAGGTVTVKQGKNIRVKRSGKELTIETSDDVEFGTVSATTVLADSFISGNSVLSGEGLKIGADGSPSQVSLTTAGLNNGGNKIANVAKGTDDTDAVNVAQLNEQLAATEKTTTVVAGKNVTVSEKVDGNNTEYTVNADKTTLSQAANGAVKVSEGAKDADGVTDYALDLTDEAKADIAKGVAAKDAVDNKGLTFAADNGTTGAKKLGDSLSVKGDGNILTRADENGIGFSLADKITVGKAGNGNKPLVIDGTAGLISGLSNTTLGGADFATKGQAASEEQLNAAQANLANLLGGNAANDKGNVTTTDIGGTGKDNVHDAIAAVKETADKGWNLNANDETSSEKIGAGDTVTFKEGKNVKVSRNGKHITVATSDDVSFDKVTVGGSVLTDNGLTVGNGKAGKPVSLTKDGLNNGGNKIANVAKGTDDTDAVNVAQLKAAAAKATSKVDSGNDNIVVTPEQNADGSTTYKVATAPNLKADSFTAGDTVVNNDGVKVGDKVVLGKDGLKAGDVNITADGINAGNKAISNVAAGVKDTDAANVGQLNRLTAAAKTEVEAGTNIASVTGKQGANGQTVYTVNADGASVSAGSDNIVVTKGNKDANNVTDYAVDLSKAVKADIAKGVAAKDAVDNKGISFAGDRGTTVANKLGDTVAVKGDANITTTAGANGIQVGLNKDLKVDSVKAGDTVVNNNGVNVGDKVALGKDGLKAGDVNITADGINAGGKKVTGVAAGTVAAGSTDAVNGGQLHQVYELIGSNGGNVNTAPPSVEADGKAGLGNIKNITLVDNSNNPNVTNVTNETKIAQSNGYSLVTYNVEDQGMYVTNNVIEAVGRMNEQGIKFFHTNDGEVNPDVQARNSEDSSASGAYATAVGFQAASKGTNAIAIGKGAKANAENTIAIGTGNIVSGKNSGAIGDPTVVSGNSSYSIGNNNNVSADNAYALGSNIKATVNDSVYLGDRAQTQGIHTADAAKGEAYTYGGLNDKAVAGKAGSAAAANKVAGVVTVGNGTDETRQVQGVAAGVVSADSTDAINGSQLYYTNQAIANVATQATAAKTEVTAGKNVVVNQTTGNSGQTVYNVATTDKLDVTSVTAGGVTVNAQGVSIAAPTAHNPANTVSLSPIGLNNGGQRITNVAPAKEGTDAVNLNQLAGVGNALQNNIERVGKKAYAGVAGAIAQGSIPQVTRPGATGIGVGSGYYGGQSAMAIGVSAMSDGGNWIVKGNFSANTDGHVGVGAGALYQW